MYNKNKSWLKLFIIVLMILLMVGLIIAQERKIAAYKRALETWAFSGKPADKPILVDEIMGVKYDGWVLCFAKMEGGHPSVITIDYLLNFIEELEKNGRQYR